jgi:hypothetical protein
MADGLLPQCPECGGPMLPRVSGIGAACTQCGKWMVNPPKPPKPSVADEAEAWLAEQSQTATEPPDYMEPVVGWRAWGVYPPDLGVATILRSVSYQLAVWAPCEAIEATCKERHEVPDPHCKCGLYSAKTREHLLSMSYANYGSQEIRGMFKVIGEVNNWGKVIPGNQGWKAQYSYPRKLYVPYEYFTDIGAALADAYQVPVVPDNWLTKQRSRSGNR